MAINYHDKYFDVINLIGFAIGSYEALLLEDDIRPSVRLNIVRAKKHIESELENIRKR